VSEQRAPLGVLAIALLVGAIYAGTLSFPFAFDDQLNITQNPGIRVGVEREWSGVRLWVPTPRPVSNASFALNFAAGGYAVEGYRAVNVVIHGLMSLAVWVLAYQVLGRMLRGASSDVRGGLALLSGLLFAAHPLATQSVVYVVQRMTSLSALFYVSGLCVWIAASRSSGGRRWFLRGTSLLLGLLSLGSKEIGATFPVALWLWEWGFERGGSRAYVRESLPWLSGFVGVGLLLLWWYTDGDPLRGYAEKPFTLWERSWTEPRVWWRYVGLSLWPSPGRLSVVHGVELSSGPWSPWTTVVSCLGWFVALWASWRSWGRWSWVGVWVVWWLLHQVVEGSVLPLEPMYEHRTYLPLVGLCVVVPWAVWSLGVDGLGWARDRAVRFGAGLGVLAVLGLAGAAHVRAQVWRDPLTLWSDAARKAPGHPTAAANRGVALLGIGRYEEARAALAAALELDPRGHTALQNLGALEVGLGNFDAAEPLLRAALAREPLDSLALAGLGAVAMEQGRPEEAIALHRRSLAIGGDPRVRTNLGQILLLTGELEAARVEFRRSLALDASQPVALRKLGEIALRFGDFAEAAAALEGARALRPEWQRDAGLARDLAAAYRGVGEDERAAALLRASGLAAETE
jgi:Flp pilus assembly protein TadD